MSPFANSVKNLVGEQFTLLPYPVMYKDIPLLGSVYWINNNLIRKDEFRLLGHLEQHFKLELPEIEGNIMDSACLQNDRDFSIGAAATIKKLFTFCGSYQNVSQTEVSLENLCVKHLMLSDILAKNPNLIDKQNSQLLTYFRQRGKSLKHVSYIESTLSATQVRLTFKNENGGKIEMSESKIADYISDVKFNLDLKTNKEGDIVINHLVDLAYVSQPITSLLPRDGEVLAQINTWNQNSITENDNDLLFV